MIFYFVVRLCSDYSVHSAITLSLHGLIALRFVHTKLKRQSDGQLLPLEMPTAQKTGS